MGARQGSRGEERPKRKNLRATAPADNRSELTEASGQRKIGSATKGTDAPHTS